MRGGGRRVSISYGKFGRHYAVPGRWKKAPRAGGGRASSSWESKELDFPVEAAEDTALPTP